MSNQKRIGLEGTIKAYAGCSRIIAKIQKETPILDVATG